MDNIAKEEFIKIAKSYLDYGFSIIPIDSDKKPLIKWQEYQNRYASIEEIQKWCVLPKFNGFAVVTGEISDVFVLDCDENQTRLELPTTPSVKTGRGNHYYFLYPDKYKVLNTTNLLPHTDIRGEGGYAILPPAIHPSGSRYKWICDLSTPIAQAPEWLIKRILNKTPNSTLPEITKGVEEGGRNDAATRLIGSLLAYQPEQYWHSVIWPLIYTWNTANTPPLSEQELASVFKSIQKREIEKRNDPSKDQNIYSTDQLTDPEFSWISLEDLMDKECGENSWIVDCLIPDQGITCIAGAPKSGKSFIALQLAKNIAEGSLAFGKIPTKQSGTLLIAKEDHERLLRKRLNLFKTDKKLPIYISTDPSIFLDTTLYLNTLLKFSEEHKVSLIIFDSFRRFMHGDENSSGDVSKLHHFFKLLNDHGLTVIFIHHHRKPTKGSSATEQLRGSTDIHALVDSLLTITRKDNSSTILVTQDALRQDEPVKPFYVNIPTFEGDDCEFKLFNKVSQPTLSAYDQAKNDVVEFLKKQSCEVFQKEIIDALVHDQSRYKATNIKAAVKELLEFGKVTPRRDGTRTYYKWIQTGNKTESEESTDKSSEERLEDEE